MASSIVDDVEPSRHNSATSSEQEQINHFEDFSSPKDDLSLLDSQHALAERSQVQASQLVDTFAE